MQPAKKEQIKNSSRFFYDAQKLRIQANNRASKKAEHAKIQLDERDLKFIEEIGIDLKGLEKKAEKEVKRLLKGVDIYENFLNNIRGVGVTLSSVLIAEFDIAKCNTVSQMWAWGGLAVRNGKADRLTKGQKARYNPWLKAKLLEVLGGSFLKSASQDDVGYYQKIKGEKRYFPKEVKIYRKFYDDYKHRKTNEQVPVCMLCKGNKQIKMKEDKKETNKEVKIMICPKCDGTGGPTTWGASKDHVHKAAIRYMVKMFLLDLYVAWRNIEGLPVREPYAQQYLNIVHHDSKNKLGHTCANIQ